jgi:3-hydroxyisobutyrate dehydrogenase-like beta-hydroxyacid dehydrogenase
VRSIGFIGFGEAGFTIGSGLRTAGLDRLFAYDIATHSADRGPLIRHRARESGATLVASPGELAASCDLLFSTVTAASALEAAQQAAPHLLPHHIYADLNSVSPALKRHIDAAISATGAAFVEAAVMAPVQPYGQRVPMLLGGAGASRLVEIGVPLGMRVQVLSGPVGTAAAVKMCRSIVVKGLEALLCECVLGASRYGADAHVFASLSETYPGIDWTGLANYAMGRVVVHGERRAHEMEEVAATLEAIGVEPIMAAATARRQAWSVERGLKSYFGPEGPKTYRDVVAVLAQGESR